MDDVAEIAIVPFQDMLDKSRIAVSNAGEDEAMLKAARSLVKEAERALQNVEERCKKSFEKFGTNFVDFLKEHDEIGEYQLQLMDLLYDFDDYIEADSFDATKFAELQDLSHKAAVKIRNVLCRMKLEPPEDDDRRFNSPLSPPSSPQPPSSAPAEPSVTVHDTTLRNDSVGGSADRDVPPTNETATLIEITTDTPKDADNMPSKMPVPQPMAIPIRTDVPRLHEDWPRQEQPPPPPVADPWKIPTSSVVEMPRTDRLSSSVPRGFTIYDEPEETFPVSPVHTRRFSEITHQSALTGHDIHEARDRFSSSGFHTGSLPSNETRQRTSTMQSKRSPAIPEESSFRTNDHIDTAPNTHPFSPTDYSQQNRRLNSQIEDLYQSEIADPIAPVRPEHITSASVLPRRYSTGPVQDRRQSTSTTASTQPGLEVAPYGYTDGQDGLIPVISDSSGITPVHVPPRDCSIGGGSSFYLAKGFCEGSKEALKGGTGVKKTRRPGLVTTTTVARCIGCMYEHEVGALERDVNKKESGNYSNSNIRYRRRFLQKSHVPTKRVDDIMFGCLFCVHLGRTTHESDATVFFTPQSLMAHIARHPRPLPEVSGVTVIYDAKLPDQYHNDFDLHFLSPPSINPIYTKVDDIANLPTAFCKEVARRIYGKRLLQDMTPALELAQGARVSGIMWPPKYQGEWCFGWHDGAYATVPTEILNLDAPPTGELKYGGTSQIQAKARWKFAPKDKDLGDWLKFDKDELITNIGWPYPEHWCWSGTNSRGKWGIFPQAFIDTNSVKEPIAGTLMGSNKHDGSYGDTGRGSISMFSRISMRRSSGKPPSLADSTGSH